MRGIRLLQDPVSSKVRTVRAVTFKALQRPPQMKTLVVMAPWGPVPSKYELSFLRTKHGHGNYQLATGSASSIPPIYEVMAESHSSLAPIQVLS